MAVFKQIVMHETEKVRKKPEALVWGLTDTAFAC